jgi:two-component system, LytTR family, sensor kinase
MKKKHVELIIHLSVWLAFYVFAIAFIRTMGPFTRTDHSIFLPLTIGTIFNALVFYSISFYLIPYYLVRKKIKLFFIWLTIVFTATTLIETLLDFYYLVWLYSTADEPIYSMFFLNGFVHLIFISLALAYGLGRNWFISEQKKHQLQQESLSAELKFLKSQLNPHFLFNVLNMAYSSASRNGDERTADIIEKLSGLMRYMLYESNVATVEIQKEVDFIRTYINLQKMRFSNDMPVNINFDVIGDSASCRIAPLILISFIENAFKYGVKLEQPTEINLSLHYHEKELDFRITNTVFDHRNTMSEKDSGIGLKNTRKRLELIYPEKHKLDIDMQDNQFRVSLWLQLSS